MKTLVLYFSAESGRTRGVAEAFAKSTGADLCEIRPEKPYTAADLNWRNPLARCNREFFGKKDVPAEFVSIELSEYDTVFIGFPIWYGCAPIVVNTFCKACDWSGKTVHAFATSGGSGIGKIAEKLRPYLSGAELIGAKLVHSAEEVKSWGNEL